MKKIFSFLLMFGVLGGSQQSVFCPNSHPMICDFQKAALRDSGDEMKFYNYLKDIEENLEQIAEVVDPEGLKNGEYDFYKPLEKNEKKEIDLKPTWTETYNANPYLEQIYYMKAEGEAYDKINKFIKKFILKFFINFNEEAASQEQKQEKIKMIEKFYEVFIKINRIIHGKLEKITRHREMEVSPETENNSEESMANNLTTNFFLFSVKLKQVCELFTSIVIKIFNHTRNPFLTERKMQIKEKFIEALERSSISYYENYLKD